MSLTNTDKWTAFRCFDANLTIVGGSVATFFHMFDH